MFGTFIVSSAPTAVPLAIVLTTLAFTLNEADRDVRAVYPGHAALAGVGESSRSCGPSSSRRPTGIYTDLWNEEQRRREEHGAPPVPLLARPLLAVFALGPASVRSRHRAAHRVDRVSQEATRLRLALSLDTRRQVRGGSFEALADAIRRGADLHIGTEFRHNEHVDTSSDSPEIVRELAEFRTTYLVEDRWSAGIMTLQAAGEPAGSLWPAAIDVVLSLQPGRHAGHRTTASRRDVKAPARPVRRRSTAIPDMPKYHPLDSWDADTNAPSSTFIYDFEHFDFLVRDNWTEILAHDAEGAVVHGSADALGEVCGSRGRGEGGGAGPVCGPCRA